MKKTRNSFFAESSYQAYNPNINPNFNQNPAPYQASSNYFYQGPIPNNYNTFGTNNDIESRLAKLERQINRLEYRISKLENGSNIISSDDFDTNKSNMYML